MDRFVCIHGHFYQPPRENPWLETVELQDSAYPYHDWNERIAMECYAPNASARILDGEGRIVRIVNNYSRISFNFGPTLLQWMQEAMPDTYAAVLEADRVSRDRFGGHGSALAQVYNHMILPLATQRDKETQIIWGLRDFEHRFGRPAEGFWLSEAAVDLETLDLLAKHGVKFTILAPRQARRVRRRGFRAWRDASGERLDPSTPYEQKLPSGRRIVLFFFDGPISRAVAFEGLLRDGESFARRLASGFTEGRDGPQLVHIATDGESYGHHHSHGDMALAYALEFLEAQGLARLTNYGEFLEANPPAWHVDIWPNSSWSCVHGIERWRSDCGCNTGGHPGWKQHWRAPLRAAFDWLRDEIEPRFLAEGSRLFRDPWAARDAYIEVVVDRARTDEFLDRWGVSPLDERATVRALQLMELERHAMLMYTSCGWFFDELSGIETVQVIQYAGRVVQLAAQALNLDLEDPFRERLEQARSNLPDSGHGRAIYDRWVRPTRVDLYKVGAHYAVRSFFQEYGEKERLFAYDAERKEFHSLQAGASRLLLGSVRVRSIITREANDLSFGFLHLGDHNLSGGVRNELEAGAVAATAQEIAGAFSAGEVAQVIGILGRRFGEMTYSLRSLFRDEQRKTIGRILESSLAETAAIYGGVYERFGPLLRFLQDLGYPAPETFRTAASVVLHRRLREALAAETIDHDRIRALLDEVRAAGVPLDEAGLGFSLGLRLESLLARLAANPGDLDTLGAVESSLRLIAVFPSSVVLWRVENAYYLLMQEQLEKYQALAEAGDEESAAWVERFLALGRLLRIGVPK